MPELPEVETVRRSLEPRVVGKDIRSVDVYSKRAVRPRQPLDFAEALVGRTITALRRRGKYLVFELSPDSALIVHLRMTGRLVVTSSKAVREKHTAVVIGLGDGSQLRFVDQRKFGVMELVDDLGEASQGFLSLGVEPVDPHFSPRYLQEALRGRKARIKSLLLNQSIIAGLGNIYADEALFRAGIHPQRTGDSLTEGEIAALHQAVVAVIREGIAYRGTTIRDYVDGLGSTGGFQDRLQVYGREGGRCPNCGSAILRVKVGGRSSFHCPQCQR